MPAANASTATATNDSTFSASGAAPVVPAKLDELLALDPETLRRLYVSAAVPRVGDLTGDLRGRMLAWHGVGGVGAAALRALVSAERFPWRGKTFRAASGDAATGDGDNRVISERWHLFKFETFVGPSRAGAFDAVQLDYDQPGNPFFIRAIKDEVRELRPGLWLGQAYLETSKAKAPRLVLYFGLEKRMAS
jgi:hypothetical protein